MMNKFQLTLILVFFTLLHACSSEVNITPGPTQISTNSPSSTPEPTKTINLVPTQTQTHTPVITIDSTLTASTTPSPALTASTTPTPSLTAIANPITATNIVINHDSVLLFDEIPQEYIVAASKLNWLHRHASVGVNIRFGLDCLSNYFPDRPDPNSRPYACDKNIEDGEIIYDPVYNSNNWHFEVHAMPNPNPGWNNKTNLFINRIDSLNTSEIYDYASYNMGYVEDPSINEHFFTNTSLDDEFPSVKDLEGLESRHLEIAFIWWTIALARQTNTHILDFNQEMREYTSAHQKILMDIADIESHQPDGTPCQGVDSGGNPVDSIAICPEYTNEEFAGHLNAEGRARMAKAVWVMMAILAGWDGISP